MTIRTVKLTIETTGKDPLPFAIQIEGRRGEAFAVERVIDGMTGQPEATQTIQLDDDQKLIIAPVVQEVRYDREQNAAVRVPPKTQEERDEEQRQIDLAAAAPPPPAEPLHKKTIDQTAVDAARGERQLAEKDSRVEPKDASQIEKERDEAARKKAATEQQTDAQRKQQVEDAERIANTATTQGAQPPSSPEPSGLEVKPQSGVSSTPRPTTPIQPATTPGPAEPVKNEPSPNVPPGGPNQVIGTKG